MSNQEDQLLKVLHQFLMKNGHVLNRKDLRLHLESNPSYPSFKSITDTLDHFKIENLAAEVPKEALDELPEVFLAIVEEGEELQVVEVNKVKGKIKLIGGDSKTRWLDKTDFVEKWNGTVLAVEGKVSTSTNNWLPFQTNRAFWIASLVVIISFLFRLDTWQDVIHMGLCGVGCLLSYLIVREDLGMFNQATAKICNSSSNNTDCEGVINSKSAELLGFKLSDLSISFFITMVLALAFLGSDQGFFGVLSILMAPVIIYSWFAQVFVQKKWCPLCLGISGVMLAFMVVTLVEFLWPKDLIPTANYALAFCGLYLLIYLGWKNVRPLLIANIKSAQTELEFAKFKRNESVLMPLLHQERFKPIYDLSSEFEIHFGNEHADLQILGITNPFCGYCGNSFEAYDQLLKLYGDQIKLSLVFNVFPENEGSDILRLTKRIIELYQVSKEKAWSATLEWYRNKDIDTWFKAFGESQLAEEQETVTVHFNWCKANDFHYTPATIVGDFVFPKTYEISDLVTVTPDLLITPDSYKNLLTA